MRYIGATITISDCVISGHNHYIDFREQVPHPLFADISRRWPIMYIYIVLGLSIVKHVVVYLVFHFQHVNQ